MYDVIKDRKTGFKKERDGVTLFVCKIGQIQEIGMCYSDIIRFWLGVKRLTE